MECLKIKKAFIKTVVGSVFNSILKIQRRGTMIDVERRKQKMFNWFSCIQITIINIPTYRSQKLHLLQTSEKGKSEMPQQEHLQQKASPFYGVEFLT